MDRTLCTEVRWICKHRKITHFWHLTSMSVDFYTQCVYRPHTHQMGVGRKKTCLRVKTLSPQFRTNCLQTFGYNNTLHDLPFLSPIFCCYVHKILQNSVNQENQFDWRVYWSPDGVSMNSNSVATPLPNILWYLSFQTEAVLEKTFRMTTSPSRTGTASSSTPNWQLQQDHWHCLFK